MGVRPLRSGEPFWYEQLKDNFLYLPTGVFANPPSETEGALLPKPRPLRDMTSNGKEILFLSSEESVGSSQEELSSWSNIFAGVLRDLGIDPEERPKKAAKKKTKRVTVDKRPVRRVEVAVRLPRLKVKVLFDFGRVTLRITLSPVTHWRVCPV
ncbi:hypothetical protein HanOQP8_Chr02g0049801 [Helianthus annuus]|nr:hypothetical protein HanOQP8_Chr02g0049801 [Helianthus annuus]